jgi:hypothetical protein
LTFNAQISQWGCAWSGNSFTVNASGAASSLTDWRADVRLLSRLDAIECTEGLSVEQRIRSRFPLPPPDHQVWKWAVEPAGGEVFRTELAKLRVVNVKMWQPGHDVWLPYFDTIDVHEWAEFLTPRLIGWLEDLEAATPPRADV